MIELKCGDFGLLKYKLPDIPEAMVLLNSMGINSKRVKKDYEDNELLYLANLIKLLEPFVTEINLNINGKIITDYKELLKHFEMIPFLTQIATEVFKALSFNDKKKS